MQTLERDVVGAGRPLEGGRSRQVALESGANDRLVVLADLLVQRFVGHRHLHGFRMILAVVHLGGDVGRRHRDAAHHRVDRALGVELFFEIADGVLVRIEDRLLACEAG